jgi:hypothetical protein
MNRLALPLLALVAFSPIALTAQAPAAQSAAPVLYAEAEAPAAFSTSVASSSSSSSDYDYAAPSSAGAAAAADAPGSDSVKPFSAVGVGFKIGLGGIGFDVATPLMKRLNVRGGAGFLSYTYSGTVNNEPVNANLKLNNAEIMLDLFPFNGGFRISAGTTVYNKTGLNGTLGVTGGNKITIGNTSYTSDPASPISGNLAAAFGGTAVPRFTVGWGNMVARNHRIRFETELGIEVIGTPSVAWTFSGEGCVNSSGTCSSGYGPIAASDVAAQNASLQNDLNGFKVFPIFNIGLSYKIGGSH